MVSVNFTFSKIWIFNKTDYTFYLKGNGNLLETIRPITSFSKIIFDGEGSFKIKTQNELKVELNFLDNDGVDEELKIKADQNLQKYFLVESNGEYLNIKLDYLTSQDDTHPLVKTDEYILNSTAIQIEITTKRSNIVIIRKDFQPIDLSIDDSNLCQKSKDHNKTINFKCNMITISKQYVTRLGCFRLDFDYQNC